MVSLTDLVNRLIAQEARIAALEDRIKALEHPPAPAAVNLNIDPVEMMRRIGEGTKAQEGIVIINAVKR